MKKIIRWIAKISGVEKDIRFEERRWIAIQIIDTSYWFTDHKKYGPMYPFLQWMGDRLSFNFRIQGESARRQYDELDNIPLMEDKGHWKGFKFNRVLGILQIEESNKQQP